MSVRSAVGLRLIRLLVNDSAWKRPHPKGSLNLTLRQEMLGYGAWGSPQTSPAGNVFTMSALQALEGYPSALCPLFFFILPFKIFCLRNTELVAKRGERYSTTGCSDLMFSYDCAAHACTICLVELYDMVLARFLLNFLRRSS